MFQEFKEFILKGNVMDLAVAVILGAAFTKVVTAVNAGVLTPIVAAIVGKTDFTAMSFGIGKATIVYGAVVQAIIDLVLTGLVLFLMVKVYNRAFIRKREEPAAPAGPSEVDLLKEIRDALTKK